LIAWNTSVQDGDGFNVRVSFNMHGLRLTFKGPLRVRADFMEVGMKSIFFNRLETWHMGWPELNGLSRAATVYVTRAPVTILVVLA